MSLIRRVYHPEGIGETAQTMGRRPDPDPSTSEGDESAIALFQANDQKHTRVAKEVEGDVPPIMDEGSLSALESCPQRNLPPTCFANTEDDFEEYNLHAITNEPDVTTILHQSRIEHTSWCFADSDSIPPMILSPGSEIQQTMSLIKAEEHERQILCCQFCTSGVGLAESLGLSPNLVGQAPPSPPHRTPSDEMSVHEVRSSEEHLYTVGQYERVTTPSPSSPPLCRDSLQALQLLSSRSILDVDVPIETSERTGFTTPSFDIINEWRKAFGAFKRYTPPLTPQHTPPHLRLQHEEPPHNSPQVSLYEMPYHSQRHSFQQSPFIKEAAGESEPAGPDPFDGLGAKNHAIPRHQARCDRAWCPWGRTRSKSSPCERQPISSYPEIHTCEPLSMTCSRHHAQAAMRHATTPEQAPRRVRRQVSTAMFSRTWRTFLDRARGRYSTSDAISNAT
mgnify:FL=1